MNRFLKNSLVLCLLISLLLPVLVSCGAEKDVNVPSGEILSAVLSVFSKDDTDGLTVYTTSGTIESAKEPDLSYMGYLFSGEYDAELPALESAEHYAMAFSTGLYPFEADIFRAKDEGGAKELYTLLEERTARKNASRGEVQNYSTSWTPILDGMELYRSGSYVILLATTDNELAKATIRAVIGAENNTESETASDVASVIPTGVVDIPSNVSEVFSGDADFGAKVAGQCEPPLITLKSYSQPTYLVLGGTCEEGAVITVTGGVRDITVHTTAGNWIAELPIAESGATTLRITQKTDGKAESQAVLVSASPNNSVDLTGEGVCQVAIGDYGQGHFYGQREDYEGTNILSDKQIKSLTSRIKSKVSFLKKQNCELIYMIVPNPVAIYPETAPAIWTASTKDTTRTAQFEACATEAGATVVDLTEILMAHRDDEFQLFHKTDSHWTDYGAYWGYYALAEYLASSTGNDLLKPMEIDGNLSFYTRDIIGGDMMTHLRVANDTYHELATYVKWLTKAVSAPELYKQWDYYTNEIDFTPVQNKKTVKNTLSTETLPTAMLVRDSFSSNCYQYLNNLFGAVYWQSMWDYSFDESEIKKKKPNYYIILIAERNISNVLG